MNEQSPHPDPEISHRLGLALKPRHRLLRAMFALATLILIVLAGFAVYSRWQSTPPVAYITAPVSRGPLAVNVNATGTLQPRDQVDVGAEISGRVDEVRADYNDRVTKGQVLAVINTDQIRAQLAQAEASFSANRASVASNEATLREAQDRRVRARGLLARGGISAQDVEIADATYDRSVANLAKARADVENAAAQVAAHKTSLEKAQVRSPIDGMVLDRRVSPGQTVAAAFQTPVLFTLASDLARMQLAVDIDEADIGLVREGQTASFTVDAYPQRRFEARLVSLRNAPKTVNGVVTYQGVLQVENPDMVLRPGLTATVDILVSEIADALLVPNGGLRFTPPAAGTRVTLPLPGQGSSNQARVYVLENGKLAAHELNIGRSDGRNTQVLSGDLQPGMPIVTDIAPGANDP